MVRQDTNTSTSLFPWQVKKRWCGFVGGACLSSSSSSFLPLLARQYLLSARSWGEEPLVKKLCPPCATARRPSLMTPRQIEGSFTARMWKRCGTWRRRWLPALCRTPPARSPPPEASCGRCYDDKHGRSEKCCQNSSSEDFWKHRTHVRDALRLQTQKSFPHEQQFGGEVWYTVNPHHEISNHLTHVTKKWDREKQLPNTSYGATHEKYWQLFSVVVPPVPLIHAVRCFSYHIRCFTEEQTTRGNIFGSGHWLQACLSPFVIQALNSGHVPLGHLSRVSPRPDSHSETRHSWSFRGKNHHKLLQLAGWRLLQKFNMKSYGVQCSCVCVCDASELKRNPSTAIERFRMLPPWQLHTQPLSLD